MCGGAPQPDMSASNAAMARAEASRQRSEAIAEQQRQEAAAARADMERRETERTGRIAQGRTQISSAFDQFNPAFFDGYERAAINAATPEVDRQFTRARDRAKEEFAGRRMLESSVANTAFGDLTERRGKMVSDIANTARNSAQELRSRSEQSRGDLLALNEQTADPSMISSQALGRATALQSVGGMVPDPIAQQSRPEAVADVFSAVLAPFGAFQGERNRQIRPLSRLNASPSRGNVSVVN